MYGATGVALDSLNGTHEPQALNPEPHVPLERKLADRAVPSHVQLHEWVMT